MSAADKTPSQSDIAETPMTPYAVFVVVLCCIINIADGLDFATMVQAAPVLDDAWGISARTIGMLFAMTAVGMAVGSFFVAPRADNYGRRVVVLFALSLITVALLLSAACTAPWQLLILRFVTGIGVGSLLPNLNVLVIEYSNRKWGGLFLSIMHMSFAIGITLASQIGFWFVVDLGWEILFIAAGTLNLVILILVFLFLPESPEFLASVQPRGALERINRTRARLGVDPIESLPPSKASGKSKTRLADLITPGTALGTTALWVAGLCYSLVSYYHLSWTPKVIDDAGVPTRIALLASTLTSVGSILGNLSMGVLSGRMNTARITTIYFMAAAAAFLAFGIMSREPYILLAIAPIVSFFIQGAFSGLMINTTRFYPPHLRSTGVGCVVGFGRFGAIAGPLLGGLVLGGGGGLIYLYAAIATITLIAGVAIHIAGAGEGQRVSPPAPAAN